MSQDDLNNWLKVSAENKITVKNTWQSTLIEHFTDINRFKGKGNVNFQKASCTLEGCMKVYSTRVDDVSEKTLKLLEIFNKEEETKKKNISKKKSDFIERNLQNINLKENDDSYFYDPIFSYVLLKTDDYFLQDILEPTNEGMNLYLADASEIIMNDPKIDLDIEILPICDSLKDYDSMNQIIPRPIEVNDVGCEMDNDDYKQDSECNNDICLDNNYPETQEIKESIKIYQETPFGYYKGWAGPINWKINLKIGTKECKPKVINKQKFFMDFTQEIDSSILNIKVDSVMSKEAILERRKTKNLLPDDYNYEINDLYRYFIQVGYFGNRSVNEKIEAIKSADIVSANVDDNVTKYENETVFEVENQKYDDFIDDYDAGKDLSFQIDHRLNLNKDIEEEPLSLKFTKAPKRVDIKRLKENLQRSLMSNKSTITEIFKDVGSYYTEKEAKDISFHFCLISMLHLANENNLELKSQPDEIFIFK